MNSLAQKVVSQASSKNVLGRGEKGMWLDTSAITGHTSNVTFLPSAIRKQAHKNHM